MRIGRPGRGALTRLTALGAAALVIAFALAVNVPVAGAFIKDVQLRFVNEYKAPDPEALYRHEKFRVEWTAKCPGKSDGTLQSGAEKLVSCGSSTMHFTMRILTKPGEPFNDTEYGGIVENHVLGYPSGGIGVHGGKNILADTFKVGTHKYGSVENRGWFLHFTLIRRDDQSGHKVFELDASIVS
jgi:hypothetical protein